MRRMDQLERRLEALDAKCDKILYAMVLEIPLLLLTCVGVMIGVKR